MPDQSVELGEFLLASDGDYPVLGPPRPVPLDAVAQSAAFSGRFVASNDVRNIVTLTQAAYDALTPKVATTLYITTD